MLPPRLRDSTTIPPLEHYGWINHHYGYWEYDPGVGWAWIPGYTWSATQVTWYTGYEYSWGSPLPPPDVLLPRPGEVDRSIQAGRDGLPPGRTRGGFDEWNLRAILEKIQTHRVVATTREFLRASLSLDFPLALFGPERIPPPGLPPVPHFIFVTPE